MLIDHFVMGSLIVISSIVFDIVTDYFQLEIKAYINSFVFFFFVFVYLNKDILKGKSPGKRILGYRVVDNSTGLEAEPFKCFLRNLTIFLLWPVEGIVCFINPERRLGDLIANTKVEVANTDSLRSIFKDLKGIEITWSYLLILGTGVIYCYCLNWWLGLNFL